jgi:transcriptional regulator, LysR family
MADTDIEIDLIRAFIAVAQSGSFTTAAALINRSQSAVSQKIIRLEQVLGYPVFERTSRSLMLTEKGRELLVASRRLLVHYSDFLAALNPRSATPRLRLGFSENLVPTLLPRILARFADRHPEVELDLTTGLSHQLLDEEKAGRLDLVISKRTQGNPGAGQVIWREPLVWIAAADYTIDAREPLRLVTMRPPCGYRDLLGEALARVERDWVWHLPS